MVAELLRQLFRKPATNPFPAKYLPPSMTQFLQKASRGEAAIHPPVEVPPQYRGKLAKVGEECTGCGLCVRICPGNAIELVPETKQIRIYIPSCVFCGQCTEICPKGGLAMSEIFLLADTDRYSANLVVE
ncbi:MAG: 4Fe-4S dicluster domain-containing protein [Methanomicrobiales archaeon]|nr:4Fe-4S dicluster domain-containing protein [Methanomicrobiales archaeon]